MTDEVFTPERLAELLRVARAAQRDIGGCGFCSIQRAFTPLVCAALCRELIELRRISKMWEEENAMTDDEAAPASMNVPSGDPVIRDAVGKVVAEYGSVLDRLAAPASLPYAGTPCDVCGKCPCYDHERKTIPAPTSGAPTKLSKPFLPLLLDDLRADPEYAAEYLDAARAEGHEAYMVAIDDVRKSAQPPASPQPSAQPALAPPVAEWGKQTIADAMRPSARE